MAQFISHKKEVLAQMQGNIKRALTAMGITAVAGIKDKIDEGYYETYKPHLKAKGTAIRDTSTLFGSIESQVVSEDTVAVGTNVEYAIYVHEGTRKMKERPFIKDGVSENSDKIIAKAQAELKKGF